MQIQKSNEDLETGNLYLVPTPIGNLQDMTFRAVETLKTVDLILAEDTRNTQKLLNHFDIHTPQMSFHEHNKFDRIEGIIDKLQAGQNIAQVSDAGMPSISDPGKELVEAAVKENLAVIPLPGANAALTALIASGLSPQPFYFYGFLPPKRSDRLKELEGLSRRPESLLFYESPHRLTKLLKDGVAVFGPDRQAVLARELTKRYEEFIRGSLAELLNWAEESQLRGEFCLIVEGSSQVEEAQEDWRFLSVIDHVKELEAQGLSSKEAIKKVAQLRELPKREVYADYHGLS